MIYIIAKTKGPLSLHSFNNFEEFIEWMQNCVYSFGKVEVSHLEVDLK